MLRTDDLDYVLPEHLIAVKPAEPRESARLLVVSRRDPARLEHRTIKDLPEILRPFGARTRMPADLLVVNATRVLPARFLGERSDSGGHAEGLYVAPAPAAFAPTEPGQGPAWIVLLKMRRAKAGIIVNLLDRHDRDSGVRLRLLDRHGDDGAWVVRVESQKFALSPNLTSDDVLEWVGRTPLPPYILAQRRKGKLDVQDDQDRKAYQTVYATARAPRAGYGSVAAPTAGLHFTPALLSKLSDAGVARAEVMLDVGLGTFKPIETEHVEQHPMHAEWCSVPPATAEAIARTKAVGGRVIAAGTTAARTLESYHSVDEMLKVAAKETRILITPGYAFRNVDVLLTNLHLPKSTLMAMVAARLVAPGADPASGIDRLKAIYAEAVAQNYRFYSYGDAMLILD